MISSKSFTFVGDEHPHPLRSETDSNSRGASYILENQLIKKDTCLVLEFLREDKGHQEIIDGFLSEPEEKQIYLDELKRILYGANLSRGDDDCKNISFFALIRKAKEVDAKVLCGDSEQALNQTKDKFGARTELRHRAMNEFMSNRISDFISKNSETKNFVVLCGDSHLFDITFQNGTNSPSLPTLVKKKIEERGHNATFKVIAQQCKNLEAFNQKFAEEETVRLIKEAMDEFFSVSPEESEMVEVSESKIKEKMQDMFLSKEMEKIIKEEMKKEKCETQQTGKFQKAVEELLKNIDWSEVETSKIGDLVKIIIQQAMEVSSDKKAIEYLSKVSASESDRSGIETFIKDLIVKVATRLNQEAIRKFCEAEVTYTYLPWKERITDRGYGTKMVFEKVVQSNEISRDRNRSGSNSGSDDSMRKEKDFYIPDKNNEPKLKEEFSLSHDEETTFAKLESLLGAIVLDVSSKEELNLLQDKMHQLLKKAIEDRSRGIEGLQNIIWGEENTAKKPLLD